MRLGNQSATEIGPFSVDNRITGDPLPYSIRRCSSSQVFRASEQMLARQLTGEFPLDSTRKLDLKPDGTRSVSGPFTASATSSEPSQFEPSETVIGPFCVCKRSLPLVPEKLIGPFCAEIFASPEQSFMLIGPLVARVVIFPSTV